MILLCVHLMTIFINVQLFVFTQCHSRMFFFVFLRMANEFTHSFVGYDGRFILYLTERNFGSVVCDSLIDGVWKKYKEDQVS